MPELTAIFRDAPVATFRLRNAAGPCDAQAPLRLVVVERADSDFDDSPASELVDSRSGHWRVVRGEPPAPGAFFSRIAVRWRDSDSPTRWSELAQAAHYNVASLARSLGVSPRQFRRRFHAEFRESPKTFLDRIRAAHARAALWNGTAPKVVALAFGYWDVAHLHRAMKKYFGATPSQLVGASAR